MKIPHLFTVTSLNEESGEHELDWNKVVDLLIKLAGIAGVIVGVWASKQSSNASATAAKAKTESSENRSFIEVDRGSNYVQSVIAEQTNQNKK